MKARLPAEVDSRMRESSRRDSSRLLTMSLISAGWAFWYAIYRAYYGFGGTVGMFGTPVSEAQWRGINLAGAALLLGVAVLPLAVLPLWRMPRVRPILLALCWLLAVGFIMHAVVDDIERILSLTGVLQLDYPLFTTVDRRVADLQDLLFNETWFLIEGILWGILGWMNFSRSSARLWWVGSGLAAVAVLTSIGLLSAFGVIGKFVVG